ncbi:hypothetical protein [Aneurinibacillus migulanus]|uniref:Uncharacterized protein n=1 Tax=Aneurinibacillus migulanus TaxID=47500 RepID=A0A1G8T4A3_ANEMI|nr:hypothetical protein [Aneurinibacillus migulanus]SDJ36439.1 hypothetical protein SAMN04487909_11684 [Aneurinibacillus migulanus]
MKIIISDEKLSIVDQDENKNIWMKWDDIYAIHYYKLDCITEVVTCLEFDYENGEYLEVNSTNEGWENLINGLHKYIPIQKENWKTNMLKCKLDDNGHTIYRRI